MLRLTVHQASKLSAKSVNHDVIQEKDSNGTERSAFMLHVHLDTSRNKSQPPKLVVSRNATQDSSWDLKVPALELVAQDTLDLKMESASDIVAVKDSPSRMNSASSLLVQLKAKPGITSLTSALLLSALVV